MPSRMGRRYPNDYTEDRLREIAGEPEKAVTVPVNVRVEAEHRVYDLGEMKEILRGAERIVLQDCGCKTEFGNCDSPTRVCLSIDEAAEGSLRHEEHHPQEVSLDEALEALEVSHEAGLVHMAYTMKGDARPTVICSCCPCCCHTLGGPAAVRVIDAGAHFPLRGRGRRGELQPLRRLRGPVRLRRQKHDRRGAKLRPLELLRVRPMRVHVPDRLDKAGA